VAEDAHRCRSCGDGRLRVFLSLGDTPLADALLTPDDLVRPEPRYPLDVAFCPDCTLVQILAEVPPQTLFVDNYLYFSSFSDEFLAHSRRHAEALVEQRGLDGATLVAEVGSNDGYLLQNFVERGIPVLGIDPAPGQAAAAEALGVTTVPEFFDAELAQRLVRESGHASVVIANNVMAHTPNLNGFVEGISILLADDGIATVENPYVRELIDHCEFDTIYHEHFSYFSCTSVERLMRRHGLRLVRVERFPVHGGTLRWWVAKDVAPDETVRRYLDEEAGAGLNEFAYYERFAERVASVRTDLLELVRRFRADGSRIAAYGAAAKGSTLLNVVGLGPDLIDFVVDRNVHKQGLLMPGVHIPIRPPEALLDERPDYVLLLAWNFAEEILAQQDEYRAGGGRFILPVPEPRVIG
jgi:SAM-dependent methyltransferase